ncbi:MAG: hypothetical protein ACRC2R_21180 [Xenococcaceae cyanobacterium]
MNLSFKDSKFIIEAIDCLLEKYEERLTEIEDVEDYEDEASDLGNDKMFLESLKSEIEHTIETGKNLNLVNDSQVEGSTSLEKISKLTLQLSVNERLLLVEAITQSIRKESNLIAS